MDTVRAGPGPDRAAVLTGRRRAGPDRTAQLGGLDFRDRTAGAQARAGSRGPAVGTTVEGRAGTVACRTDQEEGQGTPWSRSAMMHTGRDEMWRRARLLARNLCLFFLSSFFSCMQVM